MDAWPFPQGKADCRHYQEVNDCAGEDALMIMQELKMLLMEQRDASVDVP